MSAPPADRPPKSARTRLHRARWFQLTLGLAVTAGCLGWAFYMMAAEDDPRHVLRKVGAAFARADYRTLPLIWLNLAVFYWLKARRWRLLLAPLGDFHPTRELLPPIMVGFAFNNLLPARIGEFVRVFVFARGHRVSKTAVLTSVALERILDAVTILVLLGLGVALLSDVAPDVRDKALAAAVVVAAAVLGIAAYLIWTRPFIRLAVWGMRTLRVIPHRVQQKLTDVLEAGARGMASLKSGRLLAAIAALSAAQWLLNAALIYCALVAFDIVLPWPVSLVLMGVVAFGVAAPSTPGYFGVVQLCFLVVLELFLDDRERIFAASIYFHMAQYIPVTLVGLVCFNRMGLNMAEVRAQAEATAHDATQLPASAASN